ncbi:MAG: hypothetical protein EBR30_03310 [Cytophagia bacterium]|nr:hypothetical protein [Cytophagia bacterium]
MAYMNQQMKATIAKNLKPVLKKFGVKGSLSVHNHSTIVLTLKSGKIDFFADYGDREDARKFGIDVNPYWFHEHFTGKSKQFLTEAFNALKSANWYDESDAQVDYFNTAYYFRINVGKWNKPYIME